MAIHVIVKEDLMKENKIKLSKAKWKEFFKKAFGTSNVVFEENMVRATIGVMSYHAWILNQRIYVQCSIENECFTSFYFNKETFEYDWEFTDKEKKLAKHEEYEAWKSNL